MKILLAILTLALTACAPTLPSPTPQSTATATPPARGGATSTATATADTLVCTVTAYTLNVRQCPGVECGAVSWLTRGEIVTIHDQRGAWYDIGAGWINSTYCSKGD